MTPQSPTPSKRASKATKLPHPRVMTAVEGMEFRVLENNEPRLKMRSPHDVVPDYFPVAVIPCPSLRSARQRVKFERMGWEEKVETVKRLFRSQFLCFTMPENEAILGIGVNNMLMQMGHTPNPCP